MSENDPNGHPAPNSGADALPADPAAPPTNPVPAMDAAAPEHLSGCVRGVAGQSEPKWRRWPVLEVANAIIAISTTAAAVASAFAVLATTDHLRDQSTLDVLAGFGSSEVVQAKMALFKAAGEIELYRVAGIDTLAALEVATAPLENQLTLTALCMGMHRCVEAGIIELFCSNARPLDRVLTAVYAQTKVVPRPKPSAAFTSALARCPKDPS